eukprot:CAMPEP_0202723914 /NCGR_PEP_ID=MMETSP1385-20130828/169382_1 /ASSEMBLY_ACC=CAM_ASM_000861 /TAXON_ID=933848 /ORGANISM="Elphidium margaritaceum" /LENGTH=75 /DNA_ID=CAMNT_0049389303 /DNA_START=8 /DNA_END=232 /DNA_ORIENTATION=+
MTDVQQHQHPKHALHEYEPNTEPNAAAASTQDIDDYIDSFFEWQTPLLDHADDDDRDDDTTDAVNSGAISPSPEL